jgi:hypothetical protein
MIDYYLKSLLLKKIVVVVVVIVVTTAAPVVHNVGNVAHLFKMFLQVHWARRA